MLNKNGIRARVLHHKKPFRYSWFPSDAPASYLDDSSLAVKRDDFLIVPEVNVMDKEPERIKCRKIAFVQGGFIILSRMKETFKYSEIGYERVIATMPSIKDIVDKFFGGMVSVVPPFIAPYFFVSEEEKSRERKRQVLIFQNPSYGRFNYMDYDILKKIIDGRRKRRGGIMGRIQGLANRDEWKYIELRDMSHMRVAELMRESAFFVNLNCLEGFNVTVAEAMAGGTVPVCYEAYCGQDYLEDGVNAYVFQNNYVYPLLEKLFDLLDNYDSMQGEIAKVREKGYETANRFSRAETEKALVRFYNSLLQGRINTK